MTRSCFVMKRLLYSRHQDNRLLRSEIAVAEVADVWGFFFPVLFLVEEEYKIEIFLYYHDLAITFSHSVLCCDKQQNRVCISFSTQRSTRWAGWTYWVFFVQKLPIICSFSPTVGSSFEFFLIESLIVLDSSPQRIIRFVVG